MNAAEITDKLGLHSLRQRAWVRKYKVAAACTGADFVPSTSSQLVPLRGMVCMKVWNG